MGTARVWVAGSGRGRVIRYLERGRRKKVRWARVRWPLVEFTCGRVFRPRSTGASRQGNQRIARRGTSRPHLQSSRPALLFWVDFVTKSTQIWYMDGRPMDVSR